MYINNLAALCGFVVFGFVYFLCHRATIVVVVPSLTAPRHSEVVTSSRTA